MSRWVPRCLVALSLGAAAACANVLGIEETELAGTGGAGGGDAGDPCEEPIIPYLWFFADRLAADAAYPLFVIRQDNFNGIAGLLNAPADPAKGHLSVDVRSCLQDPQIGPVPASGVRLELGTPQPDATEFYIADGIPSNITATRDGIGGFINLSAGNIIVRTVPEVLGTPSAERALQVRAGFLTTLRLEPNSNVRTPPPSPPAEWACVGTIAPPSGTATSITLTVNVFNFAAFPTLEPVPGIRLKACGRNDTLCDIRSGDSSVAVSDASGLATITLPATSGTFDGYLVVRGAVRKSELSQCAPRDR